MKRLILLVFLLSSLFTCLLFYPFSFHLSSNLPNAVDPVFYAWNIAHNIQAFGNGWKDLLNTNIFYPEQNTLAFSDTLYAQTILMWPLYALSHNAVLTENVYVFLTFPVAVITMFLLMFWITKNTMASIISGVMYAFCYPRLSQIGHMPAISSQWLPLFILFFMQFLESKKTKYLLLTFFVYLLSITSSIYFGVFLIPVALICIAIQCFVWGVHHSLKNCIPILKKTLLFLLPMIVILVIALFPYIRLKAEMPQIKRGLEDTSRLSAQLKHYITVLPTSLLAKIGMPTGFNEHPLFPTFTLCVLGLSGVVVGWKKHKKFVLLFSLLGLTSFILSFGPYQDIAIGSYKKSMVPLPYTYLYHVLPVLQIIRVPARLSILVVLCLAGLAGLSLSYIKKSKHTYLYFILILSLFILEIWQTQTASVHIPTASETPSLYTWLANEPQSTVIVELPLRPLWRGISMEDQLFRTYKETRDIDVYASETYRVYFSIMHQKRMINGYSGYFPQIYHDQAGLLDNFPTDESIDMLTRNHVRYIIFHAWQYTDKDIPTLQRKIALYPQLKLVQTFESDYVYEIISK